VSLTPPHRFARNEIPSVILAYDSLVFRTLEHRHGYASPNLSCLIGFEDLNRSPTWLRLVNDRSVRVVSQGGDSTKHKSCHHAQWIRDTGATTCRIYGWGLGHQGGEGAVVKDARGREKTRVKLGSPTLDSSVTQRRHGLSSAPQSC
jgi:hypothetical protein